MADAATTTTVAACVIAGSAATPFCDAFGFDPALLWSGMVGGFLGCVIAQTLIPEKRDHAQSIEIGSVVRVMVGSILFATLATLLVGPKLIQLANLDGVPPGAVRMVLGSVIGAFAQPMLVIIRDRILNILRRVGWWPDLPHGPTVEGDRNA